MFYDLNFGKICLLFQEWLFRLFCCKSHSSSFSSTKDHYYLFSRILMFDLNVALLVGLFFPFCRNFAENKSRKFFACLLFRLHKAIIHHHVVRWTCSEFTFIPVIMVGSISPNYRLLVHLVKLSNSRYYNFKPCVPANWSYFLSSNCPWILLAAWQRPDKDDIVVVVDKTLPKTFSLPGWEFLE